MNILVVDDNVMVLESCCRILSDENTRILIAPDAQTARDILKTAGSVDLILSDIMMPGEDGILLVEQITRTHPEIPVLMMTGYLVPEIETKGTGAGALGFVAKPFTPKELTDAVKRTMETAARTMTRRRGGNE